MILSRFGSHDDDDDDVDDGGCPWEILVPAFLGRGALAAMAGRGSKNWRVRALGVVLGPVLSGALRPFFFRFWQVYSHRGGGGVAGKTLKKVWVSRKSNPACTLFRLSIVS